MAIKKITNLEFGIMPGARTITNAEFSSMRGARDMLHECAKHFRALKEYGHANMAEIHFKELERVLTQIGNRAETGKLGD